MKAKLNTKWVKAGLLVSTLLILIFPLMSMNRFASDGATGLQELWSESLFKGLFAFDLYAFALFAIAFAFDISSRIPKSVNYWYQLEHTLKRQNINDASVDSVVSYVNYLVTNIKILAAELETLEGKQREDAILKCIRNLTTTHSTISDLRKSPRIGFIVDSIVDAMEKLATGHPQELEILLLLKKFRRQDNNDMFMEQAS